MRFLLPIFIIALGVPALHANAPLRQQRSAGVADVQLHLLDERTGEFSRDVLKIPDFRAWNGTALGAGIPEDFTVKELLIKIAFLPRTTADCSDEKAKVRLLSGTRVVLLRELDFMSRCFNDDVRPTYRGIYLSTKLLYGGNAFLEVTYLGRVTRTRLPDLTDGGE